MGISRAIRVFESPPTMYLAICVFCPYIQRSLSKVKIVLSAVPNVLITREPNLDVRNEQLIKLVHS